MNVRVLLVLAAVLVAGAVDPKRERSVERKESKEETASKKNKQLNKPLGTKSGIGLDSPFVHRESAGKVQFSVFKNDPEEVGTGVLDGSRTCEFKNGQEPYGTLSIQDWNLHGKIKKDTRKTVNTLTLRHDLVRFRHLSGSSGFHAEERSCSPYAGNNEKLFSWIDAKKEQRFDKDKVWDRARLCTQQNREGKPRKMLKWGKGGATSMRLVRNHHAAHVEIQIKSGDKWATVPGAWVFPTSKEANQAGGSTDWRMLRDDLKGAYSVTAIQLPFVKTDRSYNKEQVKLYGPIKCADKIYPIYDDAAEGHALASVGLGQLQERWDPREKVIDLPWTFPSLQEFAEINSLAAMEWSYASQYAGRYYRLIQSKLVFNIKNQCQYITGETYNLKAKIKLMRPRFYYGYDRGTFSGEKWFRREQGGRGPCLLEEEQKEEQKAKEGEQKKEQEKGQDEEEKKEEK